MTIKFTGRHFPSDIMLQSVCYYLSYKLSYREIEEILAERGIIVGHSTLNRWVLKYAPLLEQRARRRKKPVASSWRMDGTYINVEFWYSGRMLSLIEILLIKYLKNIVEQSHRKMNQALGWKSDVGAKATLASVELWSMIKNRQLDNPEDLPVWDEFYALSA